MIIFLDFDGVTHRYGGPVFEHADRLVDLLRDVPHVDVVLTTSWREIYPFDDLRHFLGDDLAHRVIGKTPVIKQKKNRPTCRMSVTAKSSTGSGITPAKRSAATSSSTMSRCYFPPTAKN